MCLAPRSAGSTSATPAATISSARSRRCRRLRAAQGLERGRGQRWLARSNYDPVRRPAGGQWHLKKNTGGFASGGLIVPFGVGLKRASQFRTRQQNGAGKTSPRTPPGRSVVARSTFGLRQMDMAEFSRAYPTRSHKHAAPPCSSAAIVTNKTLNSWFSMKLPVGCGICAAPPAHIVYAAPTPGRQFERTDSPSGEGRFDEPGGLQGGVVGAEPADDLDAKRQPGGVGQARDVDAGRSHQRP